MASDRSIVASWRANKRKANIFSSIVAKGEWKTKEAKMSCNAARGRVTLTSKKLRDWKDWKKKKTKKKKKQDIKTVRVREKILRVWNCKINKQSHKRGLSDSLMVSLWCFIYAD